MRTPEELKAVLSRDQLRLYRLIWERFIASQMAPAVLDTVAVDLQNGDVLFRANGSQVKFAGFMKLYIEGTDDQTEETTKLLPEMEIGDQVKSLEIEPKQHFTQPPPRYSEARLVKTMEELGIGRPSTYAPTLDTIQRRGYVVLDAKRFMPTELGEIVHQLVLEFFPDIINIEFTAQMEQDLDDIEEGSRQWKSIVEEFYTDFEVHVKHADEAMEKVVIKDEPAGEDCELCGSPMVFKLGRYGKFMACSNFPDCRNTKAIMKPIGVKCPSCETGEIVERKSKTKRLFYGCNQYPECEFVSWDKPISRPCPKCSALLVEKKIKKVCKFNVRSVTMKKHQLNDRKMVRNMTEQVVNVIGAGLAGSEAAWQIAKRGIKVKLYEMRPVKQTPAHHTDKFAELVCSNSLRAMG